MKDRIKIKVIKKDEIRASQKPVVAESKTKREAAREVVSTVTTWVSDFQTRKRDETRAAFEKFVVRKPQPSEL